MSEFVSGNIFIRSCDPEGVPVGGIVQTHEHNFAHTTFCQRGKFKVEKLSAEDGDVLATTEIHAPSIQNWCLIDAHTWHRLTSLEDGSLYLCVYSHRDPLTREVVEQWNGWNYANG